MEHYYPSLKNIDPTNHNRSLTRRVDCLLLFDFYIEHIPVAKVGLVDYISCQPKSKSKSYKQI